MKGFGGGEYTLTRVRSESASLGTAITSEVFGLAYQLLDAVSGVAPSGGRQALHPLGYVRSYWCVGCRDSAARATTRESHRPSAVDRGRA